MKILSARKQLCAALLFSLLLVSCKEIGSQKKSWMQLCDQGNAALKQQDAATAEQMYEQAAQAAESQFGPEDGRTATCLTYLAVLYTSEQEWVKAAKIYKRVVAIREKLAPNSQDTEQAKKQYHLVRKKLKKYGLSENTIDETKAKQTKGDTKSK